MTKLVRKRAVAKVCLIFDRNIRIRICQNSLASPSSDTGRGSKGLEDLVDEDGNLGDEDMMQFPVANVCLEHSHRGKAPSKAILSETILWLSLGGDFLERRLH